MKPIILKNLCSHRERNMKFGVMFMTTVMLCIFVKSFNLQLNELMVNGVQRVMGGDIVVW